MHDLPDWMRVDDHITRTTLWMKYKTGPKKDDHRPECECVDCCGEYLQRQIRDWRDFVGER